MASGDVEEKLRGFPSGASHRRIFSSSSNHSDVGEKLSFLNT